MPTTRTLLTLSPHAKLKSVEGGLVAAMGDQALYVPGPSRAERTWAAALNAGTMTSESGHETSPFYAAMDSAGMISRRVVTEKVSLCTLVPAVVPFSLSPASPRGRTRLNPYAYVHCHGRQLSLTSPTAIAELVVYESELLQAIAQNDAEGSGGNLPGELRALLVGSGLLSAEADNSVALSQMSFPEAIAHRASRLGQPAGLVGATFAGLKRGLPPPMNVERPQGTLRLLQPEFPANWPRVQAVEAMAETSSQAGTFTLTAGILAALLHEAAREKHSSEEELTTPHGSTRVRVGSRPTPSGGALHETELYLVALDVPGLPSGIHHYSAKYDAFEQVASQHEAARVLCSDCDTRPILPSAGLVLTARFSQRAWKYSGTAYVNCLKNAGALLQTLSVVGHSLGLRLLAQPIPDRCVTEILGLDPLVEGSIAFCVLAPGKTIEQG